MQDAPGQPRSGAVISAAPVRNRQPDEDEGTTVATAAQIAMLGGQWKPSAEAPEGAEPQLPGPKPEVGCTFDCPPANDASWVTLFGTNRAALYEALGGVGRRVLLSSLEAACIF